MSALELAARWYLDSPPGDILLTPGDVFRRIPYSYASKSTGHERTVRVPAVYVGSQFGRYLPDETPPTRLPFMRVYLLDELLAIRPEVWSRLPAMAARQDMDYWLMPAWPSRWDVELAVVASESFQVDWDENLLSKRLAGLRDDYWQRFDSYVTQQGEWEREQRWWSEGGLAGVPTFQLEEFEPQKDPLPRPPYIREEFFSEPLQEGEICVEPKRLALILRHFRRAAADQEWWEAQWAELREVPALVGYGLDSHRATANLVHALRRVAGRLPALEGWNKKQADQIRAAFQSAGMANS